MVNGNLEECLRFKQSFAFVDIPLRSMCGTWTTSTICNYKEDQMHLRQLPGTSLMQQFDASVGAFFFSSETSDCGYDTRNGFTTMPAAFAFGTVRFSPYHFTGKERDAESGNDYFGARYYSSAMGRFMSPDWSAKREPVPYAKLDNPQSLNLYAYVFNNPLSHIDADGHATWFDPKGKKIGTDGVNDGGVVIAQRNSVAFSPDHSIIDMAASGTPMYSFSKEEIGAMKDSVARTLAPSTTGDMKGGFHEEGFTEKGGVITPAPAGPGYKPGDSEAHVNLPIGPSTTLEEHTHPSGSDATFGGTKFDPMPSGPDMRNAANAQFLSTTDITHVQVSAANSDVHVYTGSGVQATFNLSGAP